jgi:hypothetical protein
METHSKTLGENACNILPIKELCKNIDSRFRPS